ncbi:hypothetical protein [Labilibaculum sp.]|uniref:hypothetical protein n=1 Tax=Labilibaculum sp. TaxID=2060723 RepID=UPI0035661B26
MNINLVTEYSLWWAILFAFISFLFAFGIYFFKKPYHKDLALPKIYLLAVLRASSIFLLLFLLLSPKFKFTSTKIERPILVFAQDNSKSLLYGKDSLFLKNEYPFIIEKLLDELKASFDVRNISFGSEVKELSFFNYSESNTNFSELFDFLKNNYAYSNNVQVLLASDGLFNKGMQPRYAVQNLNVPIHTLQLGDTTELQDVLISSLKSNEIAFLGSKLPIRIGVKATNLANELVQLKIYNDSKLLISDEIQLKTNSFFIEKDYFIASEKPGLQKFKVVLSCDKTEHSKFNNQDEFVVDILDTQRKIAICFDQYHPDIAAIQSAINKNINFTLDLVNLKNKEPDLEKYDLLIFSQIPSSQNSYSALFQKIRRKKIPILMLIGGDSDLSTLSNLKLGIETIENDGLFSESSIIWANTFDLFEISQSQQELLNTLPPFLSPLAKFQFNSEYHILGYKEIKSTPTKQAQIAFSYYDNQKIAWIFGEGIWRWKLHLSKIDDSPKVFNDLINKTLQYLSLKIEKDQLLVTYKKNILEGDRIAIDAELYNQTYELVNNTDLSLVLTNQDGKSFHYSFNKQQGKYQLIISNLPKGRYSFVAETENLEKNIKKTGEFIVNFNNVEARNLQADSKVLSQISNLTGGEVFKSVNISKIAQAIRQNEYANQLLIEEEKYGSFIDVLFIMISIMMMAILEWFLRKYWLSI